MTDNRGGSRDRLLSVTMATALALALVASIAVPNLPGAEAAAHNVEISNFSFVPRSITIAPGDSVTWTNNDGTAHTVTGDSGSWESGFLGNGATYTHQFNTTGDFSYHCSIHPSMTGTVHVSNGTSAPPPTTDSTHMQPLSLMILIVLVAGGVIAVVVVVVVLVRKDRTKKT